MRTKTRLAITVGGKVLTIISLLIIISISGISQDLTLYYCPSAEGVIKVPVNKYKVPRSDWVCNSGSQVRIVNESDPNGIATFSVVREDNNYTTLKIAWNVLPVFSNTGIARFTVQYRKKEHEGWGDCDWTHWKGLYTVEVRKMYDSPGGSVTGPTNVVVENSQTETPLDFYYSPSNSIYSTGGQLDITSIKYFNGRSTVTENVGYFPHRLKYYAQGIGQFTLTTKLLTSLCATYEFNGPSRTFTVAGNCYPQDLSIAEIFPVGQDVQDYSSNGKLIFGVKSNQSYTLDVSDITNFSSNFSLDFSDFGSSISWNGNAFTPLQKGSYIISTVAVQSGCETPRELTLLVDADEYDVDKVCSIILPDDISQFYPEIDNENFIIQHFAATAESDRSVIIKPGVTLELGAELTVNSSAPGIPENDPDKNLNFINSKSFDDYGQVVGESRVYVDDAGNGLQTQVKDFSRNIILASQPVRDEFNRSVISSLPAPIVTDPSQTCVDDPNPANQLQFTYKADFMTVGGVPFNYTHFAEAGQNPAQLDFSVPGTLGWYYSMNNNSSSDSDLKEPFVDATHFPFSQTIFHTDGSGEVKTSTKPGDVFAAGSLYLGQTYKESVLANDPYFGTEFNSYLTIRAEKLGLPRPATIVGEFFKTVVIDGAGKKAVQYTDKSGKTIISLYYGTQSTPLTTSFTFLDNAGRPTVTISPNGYNEYNGSNFDEIDKTRYFYNNRGLLESTEERIAGNNATGISRSKFVYRNDGMIRFSQNAEQDKEDDQRYSYSNYDAIGRIVESGEYIVGSNGTAFNSQEMLNRVDKVGTEGDLVGGTKTQQSFIFYDEQDLSIHIDKHGTELTTDDTEFSLPVDRIQHFIHGAVSYAQNENATTWYSYDEQGRMEWVFQYISGLGYKSVDYVYGRTGAIQAEIYQKGVAEEEFTHFYEYDISGRLFKVYTTREALQFDRLGKILGVKYDEVTDVIIEPGPLEHQATYEYYLHGPLKRVELSTRPDDAGVMKTLQGIDYTYLADGTLKAINNASPDKSKDPGRDGDLRTDVEPDAFGLSIDYYDGDYAKEATPTYAGYASQYTGLIRDTRWHSPTDPEKEFSYAYHYDNRNQFLNSEWGTVSSNSFTKTPSLSYYEGIGEYDANGNIQSLQRNENLKNPITGYDFNLTYNYRSPFSNILESITNTKGQTSNLFRSYSYNDLGQMVSEYDGDKSKYVVYDVSGKVIAIYADLNHESPITKFAYDDRGFRISKITYDDQYIPATKTWYVRDAGGKILGIYDQDLSVESLAKPIEYPIYGNGKIGMYKPQFGNSFYELTDHLGNVRAVLGDKIESEYLATMESERASQEVNVDGFVKINSSPIATLFNHTPANIEVDGNTTTIENPNEVHRMNNKPNGSPQTDPIGPGIMLWVHPGDVIDMSVFVKYARQESPSSDVLAGLATTLSATFGPSTVVDGASIFNVLSEPEVTGLPVWSELQTNQPQAFLNYIVFDKNLKFEAYDHQQVSEAADITTLDKPHEELSLNVTIKKEGFIYIYLSNVTKEDIDIYFDDLRIKHKLSKIVAGGDFYPYGLAIKDREVTREKYRFGYQGQFSEKDEETGWNHFEHREYDPVIGRWKQRDPLNQYQSGYVGNGNNPLRNVDPDGRWSGPGDPPWLEQIKSWFNFSLKLPTFDNDYDEQPKPGEKPKPAQIQKYAARGKKVEQMTFIGVDKAMYVSINYGKQSSETGPVSFTNGLMWVPRYGGLYHSVGVDATYTRSGFGPEMPSLSFSIGYVAAYGNTDLREAIPGWGMGASGGAGYIGVEASRDFEPSLGGPNFQSSFQTGAVISTSPYWVGGNVQYTYPLFTNNGWLTP
jgi:RHS repeat-associated protein